MWLLVVTATPSSRKTSATAAPPDEAREHAPTARRSAARALEPACSAPSETRLLTPDLVDEFVRAFEAELATLQRELWYPGTPASRTGGGGAAAAGRAARRREMAPGTTVSATRLTDLEGRKAELRQQLAAAENPPPPIRLSADAADIYRARVADLEASLGPSNAGRSPLFRLEWERRLISSSIKSSSATELIAQGPRFQSNIPPSMIW